MNLAYDPVDNIYRGNYVMTDKESVSVDLIESEQIIIMEKVWDASSNAIAFTKPVSIEDNSSINAYMIDEEEFFFYDVVQNESDGIYYIAKDSNSSVNTVYDSTFSQITVNSKEYVNIPSTYDILSLRENFTTINIGFSAKIENSYFAKMIIETEVNGIKTIIAEIFLFADATGEDARLPLLLETLGYTLNNKDFLIFDSTDVKEEEIDFNIINKKRKELLLEFHNIFPYLGSYKALINIIKFFGYESLTLKEYWKNVDATSEKFGYTKGVDISEIFETGDTATGQDGLYPSKVYRKTNTFGMYYQITEESGDFDEDGIPIIIETSQFTQEEILIKLFALKEKLKKYFLPFNARIIDIVGEALYYTKIELNYWRDLNRSDSVELNITPSFEVTPGKYGFIEDLRPLYWVGTKIGNDLKLNGDTQLKVREFTLTDSFYDNKLRIYDDVSGEGVEIIAEYKSTDIDNIRRLYTELLQLNAYPFNRYYITMKDNTILFVEKEVTDSDILSEVQQGRYASTPPSLSYADFFNGNNSVSSYGEAYLGYFFDVDWNVFELSNNEGIPVGYPALLRNTSFDITWDDMQLTWNTLDDFKYYKDYTQPDQPDFPTAQWNNGRDQTSGLSWDNSGNGDFYEMQWKVTKPETDTPSFESVVRGTLDEYKEWLCILPYPGKYTVELSLYDLSGSISYKYEKDYIEVEQKNADFSAWKVKDTFEATWDDLKDYTWDDLGCTWARPFEPNTSWQDSIVNWYSIDNVEFYQNLIKQEVEQNSLEDRNPYLWENLPSHITWDDVEHLYWDELSPTFTKLYFSNIFSGCGFTLVGPDGAEERFIYNANFIYPPAFPGGIIKYNSRIVVDFLNELTKLPEDDYPMINSFVWDYLLIRQSDGTFVPSIVGVSKKFDRPGRYTTTGVFNMDASPTTTPINGYGALGDAPTGFSILELDIYSTDRQISIDGVIYNVPDDITNLNELATDLNLNSPFNTEWEFNPVKLFGTYDPPGPTGTPSTTTAKIICYKKYYSPNDEVNVKYSGIAGTRYGRSITTNVSWSSLDVMYYQKDIKKASQVFFTYDNSKMPGFTNPRWEIYNETKNEVVIKYLNKYMSYLFNEEGEYSVKLTLDDTNGNEKTIQKNGFIKVI